MKTNKILGLGTVSVILSVVAFAQQGGNNDRGQVMIEGEVGAGISQNDQRPPRQPGFFERLFGAGQRREEREDRDGREDHGRQDDNQQGDWGRSQIMGSTTVMASITTAMMRGEFGEKMQERMRGMMKNLPIEVVGAIATKLGMATATLQAQIASGTSIRAIIGNKMSLEDLRKIMSTMGSTTMMASVTTPVMHGDVEASENVQVSIPRNIFLRIRSWFHF